jgi:hypothetical protein
VNRNVNIPDDADGSDCSATTYHHYVIGLSPSQYFAPIIANPAGNVPKS